MVVTAGKPRKPGMTRADLIKVNSQIVKQVVKKISQHSPQAILIVVTNPLDLMVYLSFKVSKFPRERVLGMGSLLDSARFKYFLGTYLKVHPSELEGWVIGAHDRSMVPLFSTVRWKGMPVSISPETRGEIARRTREGGAEIVSLFKNGSAFYAPGAAVARLVEAVLMDEKALLPVAVVAQGEYGISDVVVSLPVIVGKNGLEEVVEFELDPSEKSLLLESARGVREKISLLEEEVGI